jgi:TonB-dependent SusC/RagA subfamily outer membrane receptor
MHFRMTTNIHRMEMSERMANKIFRAATRLIVVGGFLCGLFFGSYGQDSTETQTPESMMPGSSEMSTTSDEATSHPESTVEQEPASTGSVESATESEATGGSEEAAPASEATAEPGAAAESETTAPDQSTPAAEKVAANAAAEKSERSGDEKVLELEKDVVVGYGTMKKEDLTGSVISVNSDELAKDAVFSVRKALQGRAAGVHIMQNSGQPGRGITVRVRGVGTINNSDPLYIVDGSPVDNIDNLNPDDIEAMSVLKDASAAAIYGARGANGVVMITTKNGKEGTGTINYDMYVGFQQVWKDPDLCNAEEWATLDNRAKDNAFNWGDTAAKSHKWPQFADPSSLGAGTNWWDEITRTGLIQSHSVSVSRGTEKLKY